MMSNIRNVLQQIGYAENEIIGIAQLLLMPYRDGAINTFSHFKNLFNLADTDSTLDPREINWVRDIRALGVNPDVFSPEWLDSSLWQVEAISQQLLDYEFKLSDAELFKLLVGLTQLQFFLNARFKVFESATNMYELDSKKELDSPIQELIKRLGFCAPREYVAEDGIIKKVFVHAATEAALTPRLRLLDSIIKQQANLVIAYYATNPRGLSIHESSTAEILATWFTKDVALQKNIADHIRIVFNDFKSSKYDWFNALDKMRSVLLASINEQFKLDLAEFPCSPDGEVYHPAYDEAATLEKRDSLKNCWPHVGHLLHHLANKLDMDLNKVHFEIIPVCGTIVDSRFKPAQTLELVKEFLATVDLDEEKLYCISDDSISNGSRRQDLIMKLILESVGSGHMQVITFHDGLNPQQVDFERIGKEVAARFYEQLPHIEKLLGSNPAKRTDNNLYTYSQLLRKNNHLFSITNYNSPTISKLAIVEVEGASSTQPFPPTL